MITLLRFVAILQFIFVSLVSMFNICLASFDLMFPMPDTIELVNKNFDLMTYGSLAFIALSYFLKDYIDKFCNRVEEGYYD